MHGIEPYLKGSNQQQCDVGLYALRDQANPESCKPVDGYWFPVTSGVVVVSANPKLICLGSLVAEFTEWICIFTAPSQVKRGGEQLFSALAMLKYCKILPAYRWLMGLGSGSG